MSSPALSAPTPISSRPCSRVWAGTSSLIDWLNSSVRVALHNFDEETVYYAALLGCMEGIRSGTTTILDYMYAHPIAGLDDCVTQAFEDIGIRGVLGRAFTNVASFPPGIACPRVETERDFFDDVRRLNAKYQNHSRISACMAPGIIWDHTDEGFREMRSTANELHMPITMHLVETPDDDAFSREKYGRTPSPTWRDWASWAPTSSQSTACI